MHNFANFATLYDKGCLHTLADAYQIVVNSTNGKERRYSHMLIVYITVGKDDIVVAIVNTLSSLLA